MAIMEIGNYAGNEVGQLEHKVETYIIRRTTRRRQSMEKMTTMSVRRSSILARKTVLTLGSSNITSFCRLSIILSITLTNCPNYSITLSNGPNYYIPFIR